MAVWFLTLNAGAFDLPGHTDCDCEAPLGSVTLNEVGPVQAGDLLVVDMTNGRKRLEGVEFSDGRNLLVRAVTVV
jgi:hypothetical protein